MEPVVGNVAGDEEVHNAIHEFSIIPGHGATSIDQFIARLSTLLPMSIDSISRMIR